jgi:plasmid replication initiation protein
MLAIINARESGQGITADSKLEIHASDYAKLFNVSLDASYKALREAVNNLFNRQFSYTAEYKRTGKIGVVRSRWVSRIFYVDDLALLEITFAPDVVPLVTRLEEHFTSYQAKQVAHLTSKYAVRLYELLIAWREAGKVPPIEISEFRNRLGLLDDEYTAMHNFKKRVLEPSIQQINEHTDITVTYEQHKKGRTISGFSFKFKQKSKAKIEKKLDSKRDPNTPDFFIKMTDAQRHLFANKMSEMPEMSKYSQGTESYQQFAVRIAEMLLQPEKFRELYPLLEKVGFKNEK